MKQSQNMERAVKLSDGLYGNMRGLWKTPRNPDCKNAYLQWKHSFAVLQKCSPCPHVIPVGPERQLTDGHTIMMAYVVPFLGPDLCAGEFDAKGGDNLPLFTTGMVSMMKHFHALGFAHCDIKPNNIVYNWYTRKYMIIDVENAVSCQADGTIEPYHDAIFYSGGTKGFYCPQALACKRGNHQSPRDHQAYVAKDVWALAMTILIVAAREFLVEEGPCEKCCSKFIFRSSGCLCDEDAVRQLLKRAQYYGDDPGFANMLCIDPAIRCMPCTPCD